MERKKSTQFVGHEYMKDFLQDEQNENDDLEKSSSTKIEKGGYKTKQETFLNNLKQKDSQDDLQRVKQMQMQMFAASSSEYITIPSKHSKFIYVFLGILSTLFVACFVLLMFFSFSSFKIARYQQQDMQDEFAQDTIFIYNSNLSSSEEIFEKYIYFEDNGANVIRKVVDVESYPTIKVADMNDQITEIVLSNTHYYGVVTSKMAAIGEICYVVVDYGYYICGGLLAIIICLVVLLLILNRRASNKLMEKMDAERDQIEKRRRELAESIMQMEQSSASYDNIDVLTNLLNVKSPEASVAEKKLEKIKKQLSDRQRTQIEGIKQGESEPEQPANQEEKDVVTFINNELEKKLKKQGLSEEEIQKRLKEAEETNKEI